MTKIEYAIIARALHPNNTHPCYAEGRTQHRADCESVADALKRENPRFDREAFLRACGLQTV